MNNQAAQTMPAMTPKRCSFFLRRFKNDEKMLGPNEQLALDYAIAALSQPAGVPDGYVVVPREPTLDMLNAGWGVLTSIGVDPETVEMAPIYAAMLAAAPVASGGEDSLPKLGSCFGMNWTPHVLREVAVWHRRMNLELSGKDDQWASREMWNCPHGRFATNLEVLCEQAAKEAQPPSAASVSERARAMVDEVIEAAFGLESAEASRCPGENTDVQKDRLSRARSALEQSLTQQRGEVSAGDAVFAFSAMLTSLPHVVPFGACAWATPGAELATAFNEANGLSVSRDFPQGLKFPEVAGKLLEIVEKAAAQEAITPQPSADAVRELVQRWRDQAARDVEALRYSGALLSNIAFNLAQDDRLPPGIRHSLDDARKRWDAAIYAARAGERGVSHG